MQNPKVTVVTITYNLIKSNREHSFRQCIASVINQSYKNIEHLIIDGASNDGTLKLLHEYKELGHCVIYSEKDEGIYDAMNKGISYASGDYIIFLNSDDYFCNMHAIEKLVNSLIYSDFDFSCGSVITDMGNTLVPFFPVLNLFFQTMPFSHQSLMCKTKVLKELHGFNKEYKLGADLDLIIRLILSGYKPTVVQDYIAYYRCDGLSGQNYDHVIQDYTKIFINNYSHFYKLTKEEALKLAKFEKVSYKFGRELDKYLKVNNPYFYNQFIDGNYIDERTIIGQKAYCRCFIKIFGIPLFKIKRDIKNLRIYLLGIFQIFRIKTTIDKIKIYLGIIPILSIKRVLYSLY